MADMQAHSTQDTVRDATILEKQESRAVSASEGTESVSLADSRKQAVAGRIQFASLCWAFFILGWNDGTTGPLLPKIQEFYHVNYTIVSLIFIISCVGVIIGSVLNLFISDKMGLGKVLVFGSSCQVVAYLLQAFALPFPVFIISFAIGSCGMALQDAQGNGYVAALKDHTKMGVLHAVYGLGAMVAPLISTQFAQLYHWSFYYFTSFGISIINTIFLFLVFRLEPQDVCLAKCGYATVEKGENETGTTNGIKEIMKTKAVHLVAVFILVYVGVEVTLGGWTVTYVIQVRGGGPSSGYVSTGFFGGLTLGRVALLFVTKKLGEHRALLLYAVLAIGLEFVVWFAPSLVGDAIALSFTGFFLGPMYPIAMNQCGRILPPWILTTSIGWIGAVGNTGSAIIPFMTGAISQRWGIWSLQPLIVIMMGIMTILWLLVPKKGSIAA